MRTRHILLCFATSVLIAQPLRQLTDQRGIKLGTSVEPSHFGEALYADTLAREFSQVEPENVMKFETIHPGPSTYNFGPTSLPPGSPAGTIPRPNFPQSYTIT
jgi:endo-1,4-beta-xylanase